MRYFTNRKQVGVNGFVLFNSWLNDLVSSRMNYFFEKVRGVEATRAVRNCVASVITLAVMWSFVGCAKSDSVTLGETDKRFAAFYADYMMLSGLAANEADSAELIGGKEIDSLFDVHGLSPQDFNRRADVYRESPKLWRAVLLEVKQELQQKEGRGEQ